MAACYQQPAANYFSLSPIQTPQNTNIFQFSFPGEQSPTTDLLVSPEQCDSSYSTLPSPIEPEAIIYPDSYTLPAEDLDQDFKPSQIFDFGSCDDWNNWDEPSDAVLSPTTSDFFPQQKMETSISNMRVLELHTTPNQFLQSNRQEDLSAVFGDDQTSQPLFPTADEPADEPAENLYSTPLSWSPPSTTVNLPEAEPYAFTTLSPRQQSRLIAQAMPSRRPYPPTPSTTSSPEPEPSRSNRLKRKSTSYASEDEEEDSSPQASNRRHPPIKKTAHNMIEKRYRTNLNDKITALRDSVPSLRIVTKKDSAGKGRGRNKDSDASTPPQKLNKATILSKASEYIAHVERRNKLLTKETAALRSRVEAFEILLMAQDPTSQQRAPLQPMRNGRSQSTQTSDSTIGLDGCFSPAFHEDESNEW